MQQLSHSVWPEWNRTLIIILNTHFDRTISCQNDCCDNGLTLILISVEIKLGIEKRICNYTLSTKEGTVASVPVNNKNGIISVYCNAQWHSYSEFKGSQNIWIYFPLLWFVISAMFLLKLEASIKWKSSIPVLKKTRTADTLRCPSGLLRWK